MIDFSKINFAKSAPSLEQKPEKNLPEVLFVGKSNVGKSSLINALAKRKSLAFTSSKPGFTKLLNYFEVDSKFYLVDAPGYGYTASGNRDLKGFGKMMEDYFSNPFLKLVVFLIDSRHEMSHDDKDFYQFLIDSKINFVLVATKIDKLNQKENARLEKYVKATFGENKFIKTSITNSKTIEALQTYIASKVI